MIRIAICDNEKDARSYLSELVGRQQVEYQIAEYSSGEELLPANGEFDLLFLEMKLKMPGDGIKLAAAVRKKRWRKQPLIIFVTAYEKYVYDAFDVGAFQYLLKPVNEKRFCQIFQRAAERLLSEEKRSRQLLVIQYAGASKAISLGCIYYAESQGHKVVLHMKDMELEYYAKIGDLEQELCGKFFRIHKGYLINLSFVERYSKTSVMLTNGEKLLISRYKYAEFVKTYLAFVEKEDKGA